MRARAQAGSGNAFTCQPTSPFTRAPHPTHTLYSANELENTDGVTRHDVDTFVSQQDLADSYLPSFQTCVEEGKASGIMCS